MVQKCKYDKCAILNYIILASFVVNDRKKSRSFILHSNNPTEIFWAWPNHLMSIIFYTKVSHWVLLQCSSLWSVGAFINYVDNILRIFDPLPLPLKVMSKKIQTIFMWYFILNNFCDFNATVQGTRERSVLTEHFSNVLTEHVLFRSDRTFFSKI